MLENAKPLNVLIAGNGNACAAHIRAIVELAERGYPIRIVGLYDVETEKSDEMAAKFRDVQEKYGEFRIYGSYGEALADSEVNTVLVATPPSSHEELTVEALQADKNVVCEKPIANSSEAGRRMLFASARSKGELFVVQNRIYTDAMQEMHRMVDHDRAVGHVTRVTTTGLEGAELMARMPSLITDERGVIATQAIHQTYVVPWLIGHALDRSTMHVMATKQPNSPMRAPDGTATVSGQLVNGTQFVMSSTFELGDTKTEHDIVVEGTGGRLWSRRAGDQDNRTEELLYMPAGSDEWQSVRLKNPSVRGHEFAEMWLDYAMKVWEGREPQRTAITAVQSMEMVDFMYAKAGLAQVDTANKTLGPRPPAAVWKQGPTPLPKPKTPFRAAT